MLPNYLGWCWIWNSNTLATWCEELTHWKIPWCWERLKSGGERDNRGWDGWMASPTQWSWVWVNSGCWWWTGRPGMLQFMELQRVGHDWATELYWAGVSHNCTLPVSWHAKSLQLCLTLCYPIDCSPPGSSVCGDSPSKNTGMGCHAFPCTLPGSPDILDSDILSYYFALTVSLVVGKTDNLLWKLKSITKTGD